MITPSEWVWLKNKRTYCNHCVNERGDDDCEWDTAMGKCPTLSSHEQAVDALKFSERVAAKLADPQFRHCSSSNSCYVDKRPFMMDCKDCRLHDAYLAVEGEMDGETSV